MRRLGWCPFLVVPVVLVLGLGCPGSYDAPPTDAHSGKDSLWWPPPDGQQHGDSSQPTPDQSPWPDAPPQQDAVVGPDSYTGTPFGCQSDGDCFGLRCCPTPWGVKLCSEVCR